MKYLLFIDITTLLRMFQASFLLSQKLRFEANVFSRCPCKWVSLDLVRSSTSQIFRLFNALVHVNYCK